ncbi:twin-arginine translocation signal domain-containing protein [Candidatus Woesearchaeota archaeon]|nr:twin-arginine translocation signal domain-containing protein [Candidatus Woesearchaeota archaeon]
MSSQNPSRRDFLRFLGATAAVAATGTALSSIDGVLNSTLGEQDTETRDRQVRVQEIVDNFPQTIPCVRHIDYNVPDDATKLMVFIPQLHEINNGEFDSPFLIQEEVYHPQNDIYAILRFLHHEYGVENYFSEGILSDWSQDEFIQENITNLDEFFTYQETRNLECSDDSNEIMALNHEANETGMTPSLRDRIEDAVERFIFSCRNYGADEEYSGLSGIDVNQRVMLEGFVTPRQTETPELNQAAGDTLRPLLTCRMGGGDCRYEEAAFEEKQKERDRYATRQVAGSDQVINPLVYGTSHDFTTAVHNYNAKERTNPQTSEILGLITLWPNSVPDN